MKKITIKIKRNDIRKVRVGAGFTIRPMVQSDKKKKLNKNFCKIKIDNHEG